MNLLISTIGNRINDLTIYNYNNSSYEKFSEIEVLAENSGDCEYIFIGTSQSNWEYLYNYLQKKEFSNSCDNFNKDIDIKENFKKAFSNKVEIKIIEADNEKEANILKVFNEIEEKIKNNTYENIIMNITGGVRNQAIFLMILCSNIFKYNANLSLFCCNQKSDNNAMPKIFDILNITDLYSNINDIESIYLFNKFGDISKISSKIEHSELKKYIEYIYSCFQFNYKNELENKLKNLEKELNTSDYNNFEKNLYNFLFSLKRKLIVKDKFDFDNYINFMKQNGNYGLAYLAEYERTEDGDRILRNRIRHPFGINKDINIDDCMEYINLHEKPQENNILIGHLGIGIGKPYEVAKYKNISTKFSIISILQNKKYNKIYIMCTEDSKEKYEQELRKELEELNIENFEIVTLKNYNAETAEDRKILNEELYHKIITHLPKNSTIDLDITHLSRIYSIYEFLFFSYYELLNGNLRVRSLFYSQLKEVDNIGKLHNCKYLLESMKINSIIEGFDYYTKYEGFFEDKYTNFLNKKLLNKKLKEDIKNMLVASSFNIISVLLKSLNLNYENEFENTPETKEINKKLFEALKNKYIPNGDTLTRYKQLIINQFKNNNLALTCFLIQDFFYYSIVDDNRFCKIAQKQSVYEKVNKFIEKYKDDEKFEKFVKINELINKINPCINNQAHDNKNHSLVSISNTKTLIKSLIDLFNDIDKSEITLFQNKYKLFKE